MLIEIWHYTDTDENFVENLTSVLGKTLKWDDNKYYLCVEQEELGPVLLQISRLYDVMIKNGNTIILDNLGKFFRAR